MESPTYSLINRGVGRASCDCYCAVTASAPCTVKWCAIYSGAEWTAFYPSNDCSVWPSLCLFQHGHALTRRRTHMSMRTHPHTEGPNSLAVHYSMVMLLWCGLTFLAVDKGCRVPNLAPIPFGPEQLSAAQGRFEPRVRTSGQAGLWEGGFLGKNGYRVPRRANRCSLWVSRMYFCSQGRNWYSSGRVDVCVRIQWLLSNIIWNLMVHIITDNNHV